MGGIVSQTFDATHFHISNTLGLRIAGRDFMPYAGLVVPVQDFRRCIAAVRLSLPRFHQAFGAMAGMPLTEGRNRLRN
jgi:hypothetical protein